MPKVAEKSKTSSRPSSLDAQAWIEAALDILADRGVDGIRVDTLAKTLGVTKGSFYWHFKDRKAFMSAIMNDWRRRATTAIITTLENRHEEPKVRLHRLLRLPYSGRHSQRDNMLDLSMRLWGRHDPDARAALEEIDNLRLRFIGQLLEQNGLDPAVSRTRAIILYSYLRVSPTLISRNDAMTLEMCEEFLCAP